MRRFPRVAIALVLFGCRTETTLVTPDPHLERMLKQEKRLPYEEDPLLPNGMAMQKPPEGTLPVDAELGDPVVATGITDGRYGSRIPIPLDLAAVHQGRNDFQVFCAPCHGTLGDGTSVVASKMSLRKPENLQEPRIRALPPGEVFATIRQGYGLMPAYAVQLSILRTWGVVAYVQALQLARAVRISDLPADVRARLVKEAP